MNILFLNEYAPPHQVSGAEHSMMALFKALNQQKGLKVFLLSPNLGSARFNPAEKFPFPKKIKPGQTLSPLWFNNPCFYVFAAFHILKSIKKNQINVIHVHGKYIQPAAIIASWFTRIPVVTTVRDFKFLCPLSLCFTNNQSTCQLSYFINQEIPQYQQHYHHTPKLKLILAKLWQYKLKCFLNQSQAIIAVSSQLKKIYQQNRVKKVTSIYNLPPKPSKTANRFKGKTILSVGKLSYGKGTDTILKAAVKLPEYKFILAGKKNISLMQTFPKNVQYLGQLPHDKVIKLFKQASLFIINSRWPEPLSRAGLEALSFGLPIIASNRGGNQELVSQNGYLIDPDKPSQMIKAIKNIFKQDLKKLSQNSQNLLSTRFNHQKIISQHLELYQSL